jgi:hypothetical protein
MMVETIGHRLYPDPDADSTIARVTHPVDPSGATGVVATDYLNSLMSDKAKVAQETGFIHDRVLSGDIPQ